MTEVEHHGVRVLQSDITYNPLKTTDTNTVGFVYTAPNADPETRPYHVPQLFLPGRDDLSDLGSAGTGADGLNTIWKQAGVPVVGVRVPEAQTVDQQLANMLGTYGNRQGANAFYSAKGAVFKVPKILVGFGYTHQRITGGITQIVVGSGGSGYTDANTRIVIAANGYGGGARARPIIRNGVITEIAVENCGLGYTEQHCVISIEGDGENATVADFEIGPAANPVVAEMGAIANRLRATVIADCPNGTAEQSAAYRRDWASERIYAVDNWGLVTDPATGATLSRPNSAAVAGLLAKVDYEHGFWWSPSNQVVDGVVGSSRQIDTTVGGEMDYLNMTNDVATLVYQDGIRLKGNHGCSNQTLWRMFAVGRTRDALYDTIELGLDTWVPGRPLNLAFYEAVADAVNEKIRYWTSLRDGPLLGGKCWVDPALNPPGQLVLGKPKFSMKFEPVGVAEDIQIIAEREPGLYRDLINKVVLALG